MTIKEKKRAIRKLRSLLVRVWFAKNWFTIFVLMVVLVSVSTVAGLIPESLPVLGTLSSSIKEVFKQMLGMTDDSEYINLFGSAAGIFSIMFGLGYTTSKVKAVSYSMIDKKKLRKILKGSRLSMDEKGHLILIEKEVGLDIDGDGNIGNVPSGIVETNNFIGEVIGTASEIVTIAKIKDEVLEKIVDDIADKEAKEKAKQEAKEKAVSVSVKRPPKHYSPKR